MAKHPHPILLGALILTLTGFLSRILGFFYRIFLSHQIGAEGVGVYQLVFPALTLCMALTTSGIQTAISRFVAAKGAVKDEKGANGMFLGGCALSLFLSLLAGWLLRTQADVIGLRLLGEARTVPLLRLLALSLPFSTLHSCVTGYYFARRKTAVPSGLQLLEQAVRIGSSWIACQLLLSKGEEPTAAIAVIGMFCSELVSAAGALLLISSHLNAQRFSLGDWEHPLGDMGRILRMSLPLTANRVLLTALSSAENILIPQQLRAFGLSASQALSVYGVLTGMALPLLFFPSAITNSTAVMLMPSVAELQALGRLEKIRKTTGLMVKFCLALGTACTIFFFFGASFLGDFLFQESLVADLLKPMAFLCPFLYLNTTLGSALNGLGKTASCFLHNTAAVGIRMGFVLFAIPVFGIQGYLWGVLLGELSLSLLHVFALRRFLSPTT